MPRTPEITSLKREIAKRTKQSDRRAELLAERNAIGEMVCERLDDIAALLRNAGFTIPRRDVTVPHTATVANGTRPPATVADTPPTAAAPVVQHPCATCGKESVGTYDVPGGGKQYLCRPHYDQKRQELQEEQISKQLLGTTGTNFQQKTHQSAQKMVINADPPDLLKGDFPVNGGGPPPNSVLE